RARQLLERRRAVVHRLDPFTIRLKDRVGGDVQPVRIKLDPGSKVTGLAISIRRGDRRLQATGESPSSLLNTVRYACTILPCRPAF
ncbi:MAG: RRXRR domain-containing protein, partial [Singulisphaera sp.]|nr:RRXRR domain-containing protein [Singulisphaera sp.]